MNELEVSLDDAKLALSVSFLFIEGTTLNFRNLQVLWGEELPIRILHPPTFQLSLVETREVFIGSHIR